MKIDVLALADQIGFRSQAKQILPEQAKPEFGDRETKAQTEEDRKSPKQPRSERTSRNRRGLRRDLPRFMSR